MLYFCPFELKKVMTFGKEDFLSIHSEMFYDHLPFSPFHEKEMSCCNTTKSCTYLHVSMNHEVTSSCIRKKLIHQVKLITLNNTSSRINCIGYLNFRAIVKHRPASCLSSGKIIKRDSLIVSQTNNQYAPTWLRICHSKILNSCILCACWSRLNSYHYIKLCMLFYFFEKRI